MIKKRQHYIAQSYLRNFSPTKDYLYVFSFWQKRCSRNHIKNICKEDYFYGNDAIAQDFENNLSVIENKHKKLIDKILNNFSLDNLSDDEYLGLLVFMLFQAARTKTSKKNSRIIAKIIEQKNQNQDIVDFDIFQEIPRKINNGDYQFRRDFAITMHSAINSVEAITDLKPVLLVNISDRNFICGDAPIVIFNNIKFSNHSSDGLLTPGLQIFYPLNNELVLLILDQKAYTLDFDYDSICYVNKKSDIDSINKMQFINALDFVLFSEIKQKKNIEKIFREIEKEIQNDVQRNFGSYKKGKEFLQKNKIWRQFYYLSKYRTHKQNLTFISIDEEYARNQIDKYNKILEIDQNAIPTRDKALADKTIARLKKAHERMTVSLKESSTK